MWWKVPFFLVTNSEINWIRYARLRIASALTEAAGVYSTEMETEKRKEIINSRKMKFPEKTDERETTTSPTNSMDATCQWPSMKAWRSSRHPRDGLKWKNIKKEVPTLPLEMRWCSKRHKKLSKSLMKCGGLTASANKYCLLQNKEDDKFDEVTRGGEICYHLSDSDARKIS